jgi:hypothetical protein
MSETNEAGLVKSTGQLVAIPKPSTSFAPKTLDEAITFCKFLANSELVPKDYRNKPENVLVAIQMGAELGIAPMQALSGIAVINGRGAVWGDLLLAIIQSSPAYEWHKEWFEGSGDTRTAICQMKRRGSEVHEVRFSRADAVKADLLGKDTYKKYGDRMFQMRARSFCGRDKFADVLKGIISAEEAMDYPEAVIQGAPLVEQSKPSLPDPQEQPITKEQATAVWNAAKESKHLVPEYKDALLRIAGVDSSAKIARKHFDAMMAWAKTPRVNPTSPAPAADTTKQQPADAASAEQGQTDENLDAEPPEEGGQ